MGKLEDQGEKLLDAAEAGETAEVRSLLKNDTPVDHKDDMGWTALIYASQEGHCEIVQALVDAGADVLYATPKGKTALSVAKNDAIKDILNSKPASVFPKAEEVATGDSGGSGGAAAVQEGEFSFADMIAADQAAKAAAEASAEKSSGTDVINTRATRSLATITLLCRSCAEAKDFYVSKLGFSVTMDSGGEDADRFLVISYGQDNNGAAILLKHATSEQQQACVGKQCGDGVMAIIHTNQFWRDFETWKAAGVIFCEEPRKEDYGTVVIFQDLYGNRLDLLEPST